MDKPWLVLRNVITITLLINKKSIPNKNSVNDNFLHTSNNYR